MHPATQLRRAAAALVMAAVLSGCGSSGSGNSSSSGTPPGGGSRSVTPANAASKSAVTKAYATLFGTKATLGQSVAALQHGKRFAAAIKKASKSSFASKSSATVRSVRLQSPHTAKVTFSILVGGQPLLKNAPGYAVRQNGRWQVAAKTFCGLLKLQGGAPKACDNPAVTALPH
jgi:ABC-type phosphate transport system substrate-binding protein